MGNDLYFIKTQEPQDDRTMGSFYHSTWVFLATLFGVEEKEDIDGKVIGASFLPQLNIVLVTAKQSNNKDLVSDIEDLILGIKTHGSITLVIRG